MAIRLRSATDDDSDFCFELHKRSMGPLIVEMFGSWDDQVQEGFHARWFDPSRVEIIESDDGIPIGVLDVRDEHER